MVKLNWFCLVKISQRKAVPQCGICDFLPEKAPERPGSLFTFGVEFVTILQSADRRGIRFQRARGRVFAVHVAAKHTRARMVRERACSAFKTFEAEEEKCQDLKNLWTATPLPRM